MLPKGRSASTWRLYLRAAREAALLKSAWYSLRFRGLVVVGRRSRISVPRSARLELGPGSVLVLGVSPLGRSGANIELRPHSTMRCDGLVQLSRGVQVTTNWRARLTFGRGTFVNEQTTIDCAESVIIGGDCAIGRRVTITDSDTHRLIRDGRAQRWAEPTSVGDRCWIGTGTTVLKGARIGDGAVIGAHSVVTGPVADGHLAVGTPASDRGPVEWKL